MKSEYDIRTLKRRGHPLREKVMKGEIQLKNPFDISEEELNDKLNALTPDERDFVLRVRTVKYAKTSS